MNQADQSIDRGRQRSRLLILLLTVITIIILLLALLAARGEPRSILNTSVIPMDGGWTDKNGQLVTLPLKQEYDPEGYVFECTLPVGDESHDCLLFFVKYQNAYLYFNGEELGSLLCQPEGSAKTRGKMFGMFELPQDGGVLRIETTPLLGDSIPYEISLPKLGSSGSLVHSLIANELPTLILTTITFCFGLFLLICGLQALFSPSVKADSQSFQASYLHIGLFALVFSMYCLVVTDSIHLFVSNPYPVYLMEFLLLALIPFPPLALAAESCTPRFRTALTVNCFVLTANFAVQTIAHFFFNVELREIVVVSHVLMILSTVFLLLALISAVRYKGGSWWPLLSFTPVMIGAVVDVARFYQPVFYEKAIYFQIGVMVFLLLQTCYLIRQNLKYYEQYLRSYTYREMAYTDVLTGLGNRQALETKLAQVEENPEQYSSIWCLSADINDLKKVNDTLGHAAGDELIRSAAELLREAAGEDIPVYRIGGDEFVILLFDQEESQVKELCSKLAHESVTEDGSQTLSLSISFGFDQFLFSKDDNMSSLLSRADALMYQHKRQWKEANPQARQ